MNWVLFVVLGFCIFYLLERRKYLKKLLEYKKVIRMSWGKVKEFERFDFGKIGRYHKNILPEENVFQILSDQICKDLDFEELFKYIDRTHSKIGQQYLYYRLRTIKKEKAISQENLAKYFQSDNVFREQIQLLLNRLSNVEGYYFETLFNDKNIQKPNSIKWVYALSILSLVITKVIFIYPIALVLLIPILLTNLFFHYRNKVFIYEHFKAIVEFSKTYNVAKKILKNNKIRELYGEPEFMKHLAKIERKASFFKINKRFENEWLLLIWIPIEYLKISFNLEYIAFYSLIRSFFNCRNDVQKLYVFIGEIEVSLTIASLRSEGRENCIPKFYDEKTLVVENMYHPLLKKCVSNSINLLNESLLLTGTNMSGKTTFIRTIGVNSILAQTLGICYASSYIAPFLRIHSSIRIADDLLEDTSYYLKEVLILKEFVESVNEFVPCLFILDEIFKGTNSQERVSAGYAILDYLNQSKHIVLVATHDLELVNLLECRNYAVYHFQEQIMSKELNFDFKIKKGKMTKQNAIEILELYNYPKKITDTAYLLKYNVFKIK